MKPSLFVPKKYGHGKWRRGRKKLPFAVDLNDIIDFQTNTENTFFSQNEVTLYPNPVKDMLKSWFWISPMKALSAFTMHR